MSDNLDRLLRHPKPVEVGGKTYMLRQLTVRDVPFVSRLLRETLDEIIQRRDLLANRQAAAGWLLSRLPQLLETKVEPTLELLARQTGESVDALGELPLDQFMELALAALEDSLDFFSRQVMPVLERHLADAGDGKTSLPSSSQTATAGMTSPATA